MTSRSLAILVVLAGSATIARADDDRVKRADALFAEGRALLKTDLHAGCAKLAESYELNPQAIGTLLNVALCDEKMGRVASAAAKYAEARDRAREQHAKDHLAAAEERLAAVKDRVPHVTVQLAESLPGTKVLIDGRVIDALTDIPVDPGERILVVSAPDHVAFEHRVKIAEGEHRDVPVPALAKAVTVSSRRTIGKLVTIGGGVTVVTGVVIGLVGRSRYNTAKDEHCDADLACDPEGLSATRSGRTLGTVGTVIGAVGLAGVGVGLYLWLRGPREHASAGVTLLPQLDPSAPGFAAVGRF